jgi:2-polyprenyl-3-methyl-5-hydroxy-6-metoxy-1,4-benzoquinol methylase
MASYDQFAEAYAADNDANGVGALAEAMLDRGANVTGLELSERMAELARARPGNRAAIYVGEVCGASAR